MKNKPTPVNKRERQKAYIIEIIYGEGDTRIRREAFSTLEAAVDFCNTRFEGMANLFKFAIHEVTLLN